LELKLTILGCGSAIPSLLRANSGQILQVANKQILIDCGEGTQLQLLKYNLSAYKIDIIFISHLHGDHYLGLPGLLNSLSLYGRTKPLQIFGPKGLKKMLLQNFSGGMRLPSYQLIIKEISTPNRKKIWDENGLKITAIAVSHRIPCYGFHFEHSAKIRKINKKKCDQEGLGIEAIKQFKDEQDFINGNQSYNYQDFTIQIKKKISYTYITDSLFLPEITRYFINTNILYHESTYLNNLLDKAVSNFHSTSIQAAEMAKLCNAGLLILGHYSSRYEHTEPLLIEAKSIFQNTELSSDGKIFEVSY
jgi:ribonuclease Z